VVDEICNHMRVIFLSKKLGLRCQRRSVVNAGRAQHLIRLHNHILPNIDQFGDTLKIQCQHFAPCSERNIRLCQQSYTRDRQIFYFDIASYHGVKCDFVKYYPSGSTDAVWLDFGKGIARQC
jgi:hypothetical protein